MNNTLNSFFLHGDPLSAPIFCRRQYIVDANILFLSTCIFCRCQYFVNANILSAPIFCQHQYFVNANILSKPIFCQCKYFVDDANIFLMPIFCQSQYFVDEISILSNVNILSTCINFWRWDFVNASILSKYSGPGFLLVLWLGSSSTPFSPSPFSNLSLSLSIFLCVANPSYWRKRREGWGGRGA